MEVFFSLCLGYVIGCLNPAAWVGKRNHVDLKQAGTGNLGATNTTIRHIFLWFATFIIGRGLLWGNVIGIGLLLLQQPTGIVRLDPNIYYVDTVPVDMNWLAFAAINLLTLVVSVFILIAPSYLVAHIHPAKSMRYE